MARPIISLGAAVAGDYQDDVSYLLPRLFRAVIYASRNASAAAAKRGELKIE